MQMLDPDGTLRLASVNFPNGQSWVRQFDAKGSLRLTTGGPGKGDVSCYFFDSKGRPRMSLGTTSSDACHIEQSDGKKIVRYSSRTTDDGKLVHQVIPDDPES